MDWYNATDEYDRRTFEYGGDLSSLVADWQRELAALSRLEANVNNGGYLQFLENCSRESYIYASQALKKIGAHRMAEIIDGCQALVDEHFFSEGKSADYHNRLLPNPRIDREGRLTKGSVSALPEPVRSRIYELSYEFMDYPEDVAALGVAHYRDRIESDDSGRTL